MTDDLQLLCRYADSGDEVAFAEVVRRHIDFVHSAALRQVNGDAHLATDVTQLVFVNLARKARTLARHRALGGWLFMSTRFTASKLIRGERRRQTREQQARIMDELTQDPDAEVDWERVHPVLDEVLARLNERDREAILLRYFEGCDYAEVGLRLAVNDNTARMRVERALDKLRALLEARGVTSTSAALAVVLAGNAVSAAPAGLAANVTGAALAAGGVAGASGLAAFIGFMSLNKIQMGVAGALVAAAATSFGVQARNSASLRTEIAGLQEQARVVSALRMENDQLRGSAAEVAALRQDDLELARVRDEAEALKAKLAAVQETEVASDMSGMQVYDVNKVDRPPRPRSQTRPVYPPELKNKGVGGEVVVAFIVDTFGVVQNVRAIRSTNKGFEPAAVAAIKNWSFDSGMKDGLKVNTQMQVPIVFSLGSTKAGSPAPESGKVEPPPGY